MGAGIAQYTDDKLTQVIISASLSQYDDIISVLSNYLGQYNSAEAENLLKSFYDERYKNNTIEALSSIVDNYQEFDYAAAVAYYKAFGIPLEQLQNNPIFTKNEITGKFSATLEQLHNLAIDALAADQIDRKTYNQLISQIDTSARESSTLNAVQDIIKNRDAIAEEELVKFADSLGK